MTFHLYDHPHDDPSESTSLPATTWQDRKFWVSPWYYGYYIGTTIPVSGLSRQTDLRTHPRQGARVGDVPSSVSIVYKYCHYMASSCHLKVGNTCMIRPPTPNANPTLTFPLPPVGMGGGIHNRDYPYHPLPQTSPRSSPVSYEGWTNDCLQDRGARSHQFQISEKASYPTPQSFVISTNIAIQTHSIVNRLDALTRSVPIRGQSQGAGISHHRNFSPLVW